MGLFINYVIQIEIVNKLAEKDQNFPYINHDWSLSLKPKKDIISSYIHMWLDCLVIKQNKEASFFAGKDVRTSCSLEYVDFCPRSGKGAFKGLVLRNVKS